MSNIATLFIKCLESHWVTHIYGVPWEENLDMVEALRHSPIDLIVTRNEQSAVFMAATYGRLTGKIWVAMATLGPWATNMMTWVAYAQLWGMPVMVITGQKPIKKTKQGRFQVIDVVSMMKPVTKYSTSIMDASRVPSTIAHACMTAEAERPWAVHIELAEDIAREDASGYTPLDIHIPRRPLADDKSIDKMKTMIQKAHRPLILVWAWANRKRVTKFLTKFVQETHIPFFTSQMWKGVLDERMEQYIWTAALTSKDYLHDAIDQADLIIAIGHDSIEKPTNIIHESKTKVIHINYAAADVTELYHPDLQVVWDIGNTLRRLTESNLDISDRNHDSIYELAHTTKSKIAADTDVECCTNGLTPARIIRELRSYMWEDDIIALDNGLYKVRFARNYPCYKPNTLLLDNALATMWAWYSSAMAAKMLYPDQKVIAVVGDGWVMMNLWDLETIVRLWLDMTVIIFNDNAYGMIKRKQANMWLSNYALDLQNPDFVKLAESFGATGYLVKNTQDYHDTMNKIDDVPWLKIIDMRIVYPKVIGKV